MFFLSNIINLSKKKIIKTLCHIDFQKKQNHKMKMESAFLFSFFNDEKKIINKKHIIFIN